MTFRWHYALWLFIAIPLLVAAYRVALRRRREQALRLAGLGLPRAAEATGGRFTSHVAPLLLLCGVCALIFAAARPAVIATWPAQEGTVVLLIDVSLSMAASDVAPTRLAAAQAAAKMFVAAQPRDVRIGVVAFGGYADVVQPPTLDRAEVLAAIDRLELQRFTAIGNGLLGALLTVFPDANLPHGYDLFGIGRAPAGAYELHPVAGRRAEESRHKPVSPGSYLAAAVVLVSDGYGTMGIPPAAAARVLADFGLRVYTVGVGTLYGGAAIVDGWPAIHAEFDDESLKKIASVTRGEYFLARRAGDLPAIYEKLGRRVVRERREHEVTAFLTALGVIFCLAAAAVFFVTAVRRE
jgi:Ca-activated chloride channel homolog